MTRSVELHASTKVRVRMVVTHVVHFCVRAEVEAQRPEQDPPALDAPASQLGAEIGAEEGGEGADQQVHGVGQAKLDKFADSFLQTIAGFLRDTRDA